MMLSLVYNALVYALAPFALAATALRGLRDPAYRGRLRERLGFIRLQHAVNQEPVLWVHAVSVGEVQAAAALVRALRRQYPHHCLMVTTATPTGAQRVRALFADSVQHAYLPYDLPGAVRRFLAATRPGIALIMEREIWPNLFRECGRRGVPILLASARLTERSTRRHRRLAGLFGPVLSGDVTVAAQSARDAERFLAIGASPARTHVTGNVKFDLQIDDQLRQAGAALRASHFPGRAVWVAGSTHEGEEAVLLDAHRRACVECRDLLLILVPRHPDRFAQVRSWLQASDVSFASRSAGEPVTADIAVLLVDTLGELLMFYGAADIAFVGGSLVPIGGHNLLEPAALARPIAVGPYNFNGEEIARMCLSSGAALEVESAEQLSAAILELVADPDRRAAMGAAGLALVEANRGAVGRIMRLVETLLR
jgi:3-deoxy-D-manno-octulosonic-acid transferase